MAARAVFLARLLAGEMPDEIEEAFDAAEVRLFPARRGDLVTACTCPDTPTRASTRLPCTTCSPSHSTPIRSGSSPGAAVRGSSSSRTCGRCGRLCGRGGDRAVAKARVAPAARLGPRGGRGPSEPETSSASGRARERGARSPSTPVQRARRMASSETSTRRSLTCSVRRPWSSCAPCTTPPLEPRAGDWILRPGYAPQAARRSGRRG